MSMTVRRYPRGQNQIYDKAFNELFTTSIIINPGLAERWTSAAFVLDSEAGLKSRLIEIEGNDTGKMFNPDANTYSEAMIPTIQMELAKINQQYEAAKEGRPIPQFTGTNLTSLKALEDEKFRLEAKLDVRQHEVKRLKEMLKGYEKEREDRRYAAMFSHGLNGDTKGEPIREIDGQQCGFCDGVLIITDKLSPYRGLCLADYKVHLVRPWKQARQDMIKELTAKRMDDIRKHGESDIVVPGLYDGIVKDQLPPYPQGCINHYEQQKKKQKATAPS